MLKNIILTIYIIIIAIAIGVAILSNHITETGIIEFGKTALIEVESDILKPKTVTGDLVLIDTTDKTLTEEDIISYVTLEKGNTIIRTNQIAAITKDSQNKNIYSLKREDGTIENIDDSCILGTYKMTIPYLDIVLNFILSQEGFYAVTLLPAIILFLGFTINFSLSLVKSENK